MNKEVVLIGYSGHGLVVAEAAIKSGKVLKYYAEISESRYNPFDLIYLGWEEEDNFNWNQDLTFVLGIGNNRLRKKVVGRIHDKGKEIINVVHPSAVVSGHCGIGVGNFIANNAVININAKVGDFSIINTSSVIEHDCEIGDFCHIAPGAVLSGNVSVGNFSFIGANAVIKQGVKIGHNVIVGAGAVVLNNVPNDCVLYGNPAKIRIDYGR